MICKCGHAKELHRIPAVAFPDGKDGRGAPSRYDGRTLCVHVPPLGTMNIEAVENDCGCQGWQEDQGGFGLRSFA